MDMNTMAVMNVIREILPYFREKRDGPDSGPCIINVTSMGGLITFPIYRIYHGTKWAVEGFTEALSFELRPFNIRVKNIEPVLSRLIFTTARRISYEKTA